MKRFTVVLVVLILAAGSVHAQKFFVQVGVGGSLGMNADYSLLVNETVHSGTYSTFETVPVTMGTGFNVTTRFGYMFLKYVGIELGLGQFIGLSVKGETINEMSGGTQYEYRYYGRMFSIVPSLLITPGLEKVNPYARIGMIIGAYPVLYYTSDMTRATSVDYEEKTVEKFSGSVAVGFQASGGVAFILSDLVSLYVELNYNGVSYSPSKSELTEYTVDGVDHLADLTTYQKESEFVRTLDFDYETPPDPNSPAQYLKYNYPFSSIGMNFGVKFSFGK
jgi:hypothetical protein